MHTVSYHVVVIWTEPVYPGAVAFHLLRCQFGPGYQTGSSTVVDVTRIKRNMIIIQPNKNILRTVDLCNLSLLLLLIC